MCKDVDEAPKARAQPVKRDASSVRASRHSVAPEEEPADLSPIMPPLEPGSDSEQNRADPDLSEASKSVSS
ncbi:hypothetical protein TVAG_495490 [Trichomonas vaginalis G3]|uniref:Uncharacterized protein n=1 Tax=Trichomonas vaginalis (strain ATCC PRA-98 / G3) TaxID=412133 RepID=A2DVJ2_TRIV3|nr:hypothetical protein TVAGG3_0275540 [Trichomonas vaginalis G3]EAY15534.1 hypothetical protein TVAG_495490 [Trichomonas vaginalis G3]KAI5526180.1 hypothetical protein TVAGG3_0275540 [Trichomonas vaginalis G3]|eukprot:XP_001327757.1 hypothetical protein [Trichomonas vaginalis G3]